MTKDSNNHKDNSNPQPAPAPPFNPNTPTAEARDRVRKIIDVPEGQRELGRCHFAANLFQQFETVGGNLADFAGKTAPPAQEFMLGWQQAFQIAAFVMSQLAHRKPIYTDDERMGDVAAIINPMIEALFEAKLFNSNHRMEMPTVDAISGDNRD